MVGVGEGEGGWETAMITIVERRDIGSLGIVIEGEVGLVEVEWVLTAIGGDW